MNVLVAGASGFVGRRLCPALEEAGCQVMAMTRHPETYHGAGRAVFGDVTDPTSLLDAAANCGAAYYLVHSLDSPDFRRRDAAAATAFGRAAAEAGLQQIIYLGGLGDDTDKLSEHLRSRREVEHLLAKGGVPVTALRAGIIIGHGGLSWDITRQLVQRLPLMVTPRWVHTRTQPIAIDDVVRYLVGVLQEPQATNRAFDIGGSDVLTYLDMMRRLAAIEGRTPLIVPVPLLSPALSSLWLTLITDVDTRAARTLIDSMSNEVVMRDPAIRAILPGPLIDFETAARRALEELAASERGQ